jgi:hypothetical protein
MPSGDPDQVTSGTKLTGTHVNAIVEQWKGPISSFQEQTDGRAGGGGGPHFNVARCCILIPKFPSWKALEWKMWVFFRSFGIGIGM